MIEIPEEIEDALIWLIGAGKNSDYTSDYQAAIVVEKWLNEQEG